VLSLALHRLLKERLFLYVKSKNCSEDSVLTEDYKSVHKPLNIQVSFEVHSKRMLLLV